MVTTRVEFSHLQYTSDRFDPIGNLCYKCTQLSLRKSVTSSPIAKLSTKIIS